MRRALFVGHNSRIVTDADDHSLSCGMHSDCSELNNQKRNTRSEHLLTTLCRFNPLHRQMRNPTQAKPRSTHWGSYIYLPKCCVHKQVVAETVYWLPISSKIIS